jgi:gliding-associated putative ABC transporter substrate-binding component GldG
MNMKSKKSETLMRLVLLLGILIVVNVISIRLFTRFDLTGQKVYSLADASKNIVSSFDDRVTVKAYFTEDLPAPYNNNRRAVLDILNEYKAYSTGRLQFEFINPAGEKGDQETRQQGIPAVEVQVVKEDKFEVKKAYLGLVMMYEDRKEVLPVIQNLSSLEYDISSAMKRLTTRTKKSIGFATGQGEPDLYSMQGVNQTLSQQYTLAPVDLKSGAPVSSDIAALLVMAPQQRFSDSSKFVLDQYLMRGGRIALLINKVNANLRSQYAQPVELGIEDQLEQYGVRVNKDLVIDAQCANVTVMQQQMGFQIQSQIPFPFMPLVSNFNKENMMVKDLKNVIFYFVSSVDTNLAGSKGLAAQVIARTSKQSGRQTGFLMIDPMRRYTETDFAENGIPLAVLIEGSFKSYFTGKQIPPGLAMGNSVSPQTRIVVVGDGDFMNDELARNPANLNLFANIVDYLADDAGLITIRSKNVSMPPLEQISDGTKKMMKFGNLLVPPALIILYGLFRWRNRRARKKALEAAM